MIPFGGYVHMCVSYCEGGAARFGRALVHPRFPLYVSPSKRGRETISLFLYSSSIRSRFISLSNRDHFSSLYFPLPLCILMLIIPHNLVYLCVCVCVWVAGFFLKSDPPRGGVPSGLFGSVRGPQKRFGSFFR